MQLQSFKRLKDEKKLIKLKTASYHCWVFFLKMENNQLDYEEYFFLVIQYNTLLHPSKSEITLHNPV